MLLDLLQTVFAAGAIVHLLSDEPYKQGNAITAMVILSLLLWESIKPSNLNQEG